MKRGLSIVIIVVLLLIISVMGSYIYLDSKKEVVVDKEYLVKTFNDNDLKTIGNVIKEYSYDHNLADKNNIKKWVFNEIKYLGYFNDNKDVLYYEVKGGYLCNGDSFDCVYVSQGGYKEEEMYVYNVYIALKKVEDKYSLVSIEPVLFTTSQLITEDKDGFKMTGYKYEELVNLYKNYIISNGLALKPDIKEWNVELVYLGKSDANIVFKVKNEFSCLSETAYCVYQSQIGENPNKFEGYATMSEGLDGKYKFDSTGIIYDDGIKMPALKEDINNKKVTRDSVAELLKNYLYEKELAFKDKIQTFDVSYITYKGELKEQLGTYSLKATISYNCLDDKRTCVYSDVKEDKKSGLYTFTLEFYLTVNKDGNYDVTYVGDSVSDDHINVDTLVLQ